MEDNEQLNRSSGNLHMGMGCPVKRRAIHIFHLYGAVLQDGPASHRKEGVLQLVFDMYFDDGLERRISNKAQRHSPLWIKI